MKSSELLIEKAREIWHRRLNYTNLQFPHINNDWLSRFISRHNIKVRNWHGGAASVPDPTEKEIKAVGTISGEFKEIAMDKMDKTGLYWRMMLSKEPSTTGAPGLKRNSTCITIAFCTKASGIDPRTLWIIGQAKKMCYSQNINMESMEVTLQFK